MEELIIKYIRKEIAPAERKALDEWLKEEPMNRAIFENILAHWILEPEGIEHAKQRVYQRILPQEKKVVPINQYKKNHTSYAFLLKIAAVITLAIGVSFLVWLNSDPNAQEVKASIEWIDKEASYGENKQVTLPDGSKVKLNAGSSISFPSLFVSNERSIKLFGEAFFEVTKDSLRAFVISSGDLKVKVLGTSFNVKSYDKEQEIAVAVKTGKVAVSTKKRDKVVLTPLQMVTYNKKDQLLVSGKITDSEVHFGWVNRMLVFKDQNLYNIVSTLERWYDVKFEFNKKKEYKKKFTGRYENPSLKAVLKSLSYAYGFGYEIKDNTVIIN